jgi:type I restriction-modification system DNA methylase subunit
VAETDIPDIIERWNSMRHPERSFPSKTNPEFSRGILKAAEPSTSYPVSKHTPLTPSVANDRKPKCFLVPADEIRENKYDLSISRYRQIDHKEISYEKPDSILEKILVLEKDIIKDIQKISSSVNRGNIY